MLASIALRGVPSARRGLLSPRKHVQLAFSTSSTDAKKSPKEPLVLTTTTSTGVTTIRMNNPKKLNGWTEPMLLSLFDAFQAAEADPHTKAVIVTGTGDYYCAGVDLSGTIKPMHPRDLHNMIYTSNKKVFDTFLTFPKVRTEKELTRPCALYDDVQTLRRNQKIRRTTCSLLRSYAFTVAFLVR